MLIERDLVGAVTSPPEPVLVPGLIDGDAIDPGPQARLAAEAMMKKNAKETFERSSASSRSPNRFIASWITMRWCSAISSAQAASSPSAHRWISAASRPPTFDHPTTRACFTDSSTIAA
jgi:hypothetical protein